MNKHQKNRKIKLIQKGLSETAVARILGVTQQAINNEMRGEKRSFRIREALCKLAGTTQDKFFPEHIKETVQNGG